MMKVLLFCIIYVSVLSPQQNNKRSLFISAQAGIYNIALSQFAQQYNSSIGFMPSVAVGIPIISKSIHLYVKGSYFAKNGVSIAYTYAIQNGNWVPVAESKGGTAKFKEWIINAGILYNIFLSEKYTLGINGGMVWEIVNENKKGPGFNESNYGDGQVGVFVEAILERRFTNSPFSLIGQAQYNFTTWKILSDSNYGGFNISIGGRFYLWVE